MAKEWPKGCKVKWCLYLFSGFLLLWSFTARAELSVNVSISGLSAELEQNVRLLLSIEQQKQHALLNAGRLRRLHQKAEAEIRLALQPFGYYQPVIEASLQKQNGKSWLASYRIDPGPAMRIKQFQLTVNPGLREDTVFAGYLKKLPLKQGAVLDHAVYESVKSGLLSLAIERGYFDAVFKETRIDVDLQAYEAGIVLNFDAGVRYNFGAVSIPETVLAPELLQRFIDFEQGQPYHFQQLIRLRQSLNDSDYFQLVQVSPGEPDRSTHQVPIEIKLTARKPNRYSLGLGYGTDTGMRGSLGWEKPRLNPQGHRFSTELKASEIGNSLTAKYSLPVLDPRTDRLVYSAGLVNEETETSSSRVETIGVSLNRSRGLWRETLSLEYQNEDYQVADTDDGSSLLIPGASWSRTWGNNLVAILDGLRLDFDIQGAHDDWLSDASFLQLQSGVKFIHQIGKTNRFIGRARVGSTWTDEFDALPSSVRFFTGGAQTVRGYGYQSLGPKDEDGDVVGGRNLLVSSVEFEHRFMKNWGIALFYDTGNAIDSFDDALRHGSGFGFRWQSPIGPVRIDFASAISKPGEPWRVHINIGPDL